MGEYDSKVDLFSLGVTLVHFHFNGTRYPLNRRNFTEMTRKLDLLNCMIQPEPRFRELYKYFRDNEIYSFIRLPDYENVYSFIADPESYQVFIAQDRVSFDMERMAYYSMNNVRNENQYWISKYNPDIAYDMRVRSSMLQEVLYGEPFSVMNNTIEYKKLQLHVIASSIRDGIVTEGDVTSIYEAINRFFVFYKNMMPKDVYQILSDEPIKLIDASERERKRVDGKTWFWKDNHDYEEYSGKFKAKCLKTN